MSTPQVTWDEPGKGAPAVTWDSAVPPVIQQRMAPSFAEQHPYLAAAGNAASNVMQGVGEGALQIPYTLSTLLNRIPGIGEALAPTSGVQQFQKVVTPENTAQKVGAGLEQTGELAIMGGPARTAVTKMGLGAIGRIGAAGATTALSSAMHGQDVGTGGLIGGLTEGMGEVATAIAPKLAEAALGTRAAERMYGRNPGTTILANTTGVTPEAVARSAKDVSLQMVSDLEQSANAAAQRGITASTKPALDILDKAINTATRENNASLVSQLQEARTQLTQRFGTGASIPQTISPAELLDLKRGFGDTVTNWGKIPERQGVSGVLKQAYHALDAEFDRAVPGAAQANQTVSTLIGIGKDAQRRELDPSIVQKLIQRARAHTGALATAALGGYGGYRAGGPKGAVAGAVGGAVVPELIGSPESALMAARVANVAQPSMSATVPAFIQQMMAKSH